MAGENEQGLGELQHASGMYNTVLLKLSRVIYVYCEGSYSAPIPGGIGRCYWGGVGLD
jgi:hypothetical protein